MYTGLETRDTTTSTTTTTGYTNERFAALRTQIKNKLAEQQIYIAKEITPGHNWKKILEMSLEAGKDILGTIDRNFTLIYFCF